MKMYVVTVGTSANTIPASLLKLGTNPFINKTINTPPHTIINAPTSYQRQQNLLQSQAQQQANSYFIPSGSQISLSALQGQSYLGIQSYVGTTFIQPEDIYVFSDSYVEEYKEYVKLYEKFNSSFYALNRLFHG